MSGNMEKKKKIDNFRSNQKAFLGMLSYIGRKKSRKTKEVAKKKRLKKKKKKG